jgi:hypothetical protein
MPTPGQVHGALSFDGLDDTIIVPDAPLLQISDQITVSAWINPSSSVPTFDHNRSRNPIVRKVGIEPLNGFSLEFLGNNVIFWIFINGFSWAPPNLLVPLNQWTHVTAVYNGTVAFLYINGALIGYSDPHPGGIGVNSSPLYIGGDPAQLTGVFKGMIDEVAIFHRALSSLEIQAIYAAGSAGMCKEGFIVNNLPLADAGQDETVHVGALVTLNGGGSSDPDGHYPLTYTWEMTDKPVGSTAVLSNPDSINPTFILDVLGDYTVTLMVTDHQGAVSAPDQVVVSTINTVPVADAGPDQAIVQIGTMVQLDGSQSFDEDGDNISYSWSLITKPDGSEAALNDPALPNTVFVADIHGDYVLALIVTDYWGAQSQADTINVSFNNVKPVAHAGMNQSALVGDTIFLDGSHSSDVNLDFLTYYWNVVTAPEGSQSFVSNPSAGQTHFVVDLPGTYVVSLVVNDGFMDSDASNVTIVTITVEDAVTQTLQQTIAVVNSLPEGDFKNNNMKNVLTNKINAALEEIERGSYQNALDKLENDILGKMNGCYQTGIPDKNDWLTDCSSQEQIYSLIIEAMDLLQALF